MSRKDKEHAKHTQWPEAIHTQIETTFGFMKTAAAIQDIKGSDSDSDANDSDHSGDLTPG